MANIGVKPITIVHEIVIMLFFFPSFVVTRTTGPDSISVNALFICNFFMQPQSYMFFCLTMAIRRWRVNGTDGRKRMKTIYTVEFQSARKTASRLDCRVMRLHE